MLATRAWMTLGLLAVASGAPAVLAAAAPATTATAAPAKPAAGARPAPAAAGHRKTRFPVGGMPNSARDYYASLYGVDELAAQLTESGALVRFTYHVVDATKAQALHDRAAQPSLVDPASHASLSIPVMDKVGPLRQSMPAKNGMTYWMAFSNKGGPVKAGHSVSVVVGSVRIDGLIVQ